MGLIENLEARRLTMRMKLSVSLSAIGLVLLVSSVISVMEYRSMSTYVSDMIASDINNINVAQKLSEVSNSYNLAILSVIGDETSVRLPEFDADEFMSHCDSLRHSVMSKTIVALADSVEYSYSAYMLTSLELQNVLVSDFIDSRSWFFERLQPKFNRLVSDIDALSDAINRDLSRNSETFDRGFYRSIIPGIVAVGVGLLLVIMLFFFMLTGYVNPICKMLDQLNAYRSVGKKYTCQFDGDDQLAELNEGIKEIANENIQIRKRLLGK